MQGPAETEPTSARETSDEAANLVSDDQPEATSDQLDLIRNLARRAQAHVKSIADAEEHLRQLSAGLKDLLEVRIPEAMDAVGMREFTVNASGNWPAFRISVYTNYSAHIPASWDAERRQAGFRWLEENGHGSLIKTDVAVAFPREDHDAVSEFVKRLSDEGMTPEVKESVHQRTLSAWLREVMERGLPTPPLDVIGGYIVRRAKIEEVKED